MRISDSRESVRMALDTLRKNKLRSALTILGVTIGISTVILISSAINGLNTNIDQFIRTLGTNDIWVFRFEPFGKRPTTEELNRKQLTYEDGMAMRQLPHVLAVDPGLVIQNFQLGVGNVSLKHGTHKIQNTILQGDTSDIKQTQDIQLLEGRIWTESEEERSAKVVVLGHDAAEDLFPGESPLGQEVDCEGSIFTVIGVLDLQPQPFGSGRNTQDNAAYFPLETFRKLHPEIKDFWITVKYDDIANKPLVIDEIRELLRRRRNVRLEQDDNFAIFGPDSLTRLWNSLTGTLFIFMVAVSSVSL
ncbi:MAG TPA: ABC transporter permease, partial [Terracidiphilus sp.]|nr:ABC transporter permease [Terracidiphilus sp.]